MKPERKKRGGKYDSSAALLQGVCVRPTRQRLALAAWLFDGSDKHVTAEESSAAMRRRRAGVSLATIYNTLNAFTESGLLRQIAIDGAQIYFDTNTNDHYHFFDEKTGHLTDIPASSIRFAQLPKIPDGKALLRVDVVLRVQRAR
jgi:Fur family iron response transcriptional regulator